MKGPLQSLLYCLALHVKIISEYPLDDSLYDGCYQEVTTLYERDLPFDVFTNGAMTVELCVNHCFIKGYKFAGIMVRILVSIIRNGL